MAIDRSRSRPAAESNRRGASGAENRGALWPKHSGRSVLGSLVLLLAALFAVWLLLPAVTAAAPRSTGRRTTGSRSVTWISLLALDRSRRQRVRHQSEGRLFTHYREYAGITTIVNIVSECSVSRGRAAIDLVGTGLISDVCVRLVARRPPVRLLTMQTYLRTG